MGGKLERAESNAGKAIEFIDVRAVFVGDVDAEAIVGDANAVCIEAGIAGIAGRLGRIEVVGAPGEEMHEEVVQRRDTGADSQSRAGSVCEWEQAEQQGGATQSGCQRERQAASAGVGLQVHGYRVKARNVTDRIVDEGIVTDRVRT